MEKKRKSVGVLSPHQKTKERSPDMTGQVPIQYEDLQHLVEQVRNPGDVARCNVALWFYPAANGKGPCVSVQLTPPYRPRCKPGPEVGAQRDLENFFHEVDREANHDDGTERS